jgi:hypothetical protein
VICSGYQRHPAGKAQLISSGRLESRAASRVRVLSRIGARISGVDDFPRQGPSRGMSPPCRV